MVSIGSKALSLRRYVKDSIMGGEERGGRKKHMNRKTKEKHVGFDGDYSLQNVSGGGPDDTVKACRSSKHQNVLVSEKSYIRKQVDPETAKYFLEIANVLEGSEVPVEERSVICGNALEEARGKEVELATDYIISHTLQTLLQCCDVDHLCGFLRSCARDFPHIAVDKSGSHVAETAFRSIAMHLQYSETHTLIEETLTALCQAIVVNPADLMCNCYGSHVLRSLLCLCKGVSLDSSKYHATRTSTTLAERLNFRLSRPHGNDTEHFGPGFTELLKFLVSKMISTVQKSSTPLQVDQYSSLVLQTALKLLVEHEEELLRIIPILLGCSVENVTEGILIEDAAVQNILSLMNETASSHLMEVILEVAPETLYNELFLKVFRNSLFDMSSHHCGNFVVQALISHARCQYHMELIWEELGKTFKDLFGMGRSVVVASLIAGSQKLQTLEDKCCQALAAAVCSENESSKCVVPRILFLDNYFGFANKLNWSWPSGAKIHVVGSLILQTIFRFRNEFIQVFVASITSLDAEKVLEVSKDSAGARVIEAFLSSSVALKLKRKFVVKLQGHFGELSMHQSGSFTVESCFDASNMSLREAIVSELSAVQTELSKTKQGPHLLRKLDVDGYARWPDQWKSRQASKQSAYKEFYAEFGPKQTHSYKKGNFLVDVHHTSLSGNVKEMRKEIDGSLASVAGSRFLVHHESTAGSHAKKSSKHSMNDGASKSKNKKLKKRKSSGETETGIARKKQRTFTRKDR